jgi:hypothetical protein
MGIGGGLGFGDYLDAGLPVAKSAPNPYTTGLRGVKGADCRVVCCLVGLDCSGFDGLVHRLAASLLLDMKIWIC